MDNMSVDDVVQHLVKIGISDNEVREAHHFTMEWLTSMASSLSRPEEASEAATILQHLRQTLNPAPRDNPLMTEPPKKRKREVGNHDLGLRSPSTSMGLSTYQSLSPPWIDF